MADGMIDQVVFGIDVSEMLGGGSDFLGSIEVEIHSAEDAKFAFPALDIVVDETAKRLTYVPPVSARSTKPKMRYAGRTSTRANRPSISSPTMAAGRSSP
jgi:hypothetical protein